MCFLSDGWEVGLPGPDVLSCGHMVQSQATGSPGTAKGGPPATGTVGLSTSSSVTQQYTVKGVFLPTFSLFCFGPSHPGQRPFPIKLVPSPSKGVTVLIKPGSCDSLSPTVLVFV